MCNWIIELNNPTQALYKARPNQLKCKLEQRSVCAVFWCCLYATVIRLEFDWKFWRTRRVSSMSSLFCWAESCRVQDEEWRVESEGCCCSVRESKVNQFLPWFGSLTIILSRKDWMHSHFLAPFCSFYVIWLCLGLGLTLYPLSTTATTNNIWES